MKGFLKGVASVIVTLAFFASLCIATSGESVFGDGFAVLGILLGIGGMLVCIMLLNALGVFDSEWL